MRKRGAHVMSASPRALLFACALVAAGGCEHPAEPEEDAGPGLTGVLASESGEPLAGFAVLACMATTCLFGDTDADGRFLFEIEPPAEVALKTLPDLSASPRRAAALHPVRIVDTSLVNVGTLHVPELPDGTRMGPVSADPQILAAGDGLELTLSRGDLMPRLGDILDDVAARRIPDAHVLPFPELGDEEILAVYALHPFAAHCLSPIEVRVQSDLPPDTAVRFRTIDEIDGHFSEPVPGRADGTVVSTDPGAGITTLTWLVISR